MAADQEDTDTETTSLPLDGLKAELDPPLRAPPSSEAVTAMVGSLQQYGLRSALIAVRLGEAVVVLDGRARLQAMRRLDEEGGLPLPCGTGASGIPVEILEPAEGFARIFDTHVALGPPRPAARIRTIQELLDWSDVKKFYVRTEIGRNGQAAGPQHQPSWSHVIARSSDMNAPAREQARQHRACGAGEGGLSGYEYVRRHGRHVRPPPHGD